MQSPVVSVVIPVFNQWSYTAQCLAALRAHTPTIPFEVIVVNNASTDETVSELARISREWPALRVLSLSSNTGFSPACNIGASAARGEYVLFLNNDTEPQPGWLPPLLTEIALSSVGLVGPKLLYPGGLTINHAGYVFGAGAFVGIYHHEPADSPIVNQKRDYQALLGACVLLTKRLFDEVGGFALDGLEDVDLCLKIRRRGLACRYIPESVVYHVGSVTLTNSPPGSFPITDASSFGTRWTTDDVTWDDYIWYIRDGKWPGPAAPTVEDSIEVAKRSVACLVDSIVRYNGGDLEGALADAERSLALWDKNPNAFGLWCKVMLAHGQREAVLRAVVRRLPEFSFHPGFVRELLAALQPVQQASHAI